MSSIGRLLLVYIVGLLLLCPHLCRYVRRPRLFIPSIRYVRWSRARHSWPSCSTSSYRVLLHTSYLPCTKMYCTRSGIFSHIQLPVFNPMNCACAVAVAWIRAWRRLETSRCHREFGTPGNMAPPCQIP